MNTLITFCGRAITGIPSRHDPLPRTDCGPTQIIPV